MKESQQEILEEAKERFEEAKTFWSENYRQAEEDYKFLFGFNQWDDAYAAHRKQNGHPCLTLNLLKPYADQVINDIRQARPAIRVSPVDDKADVDTAEIYGGIIRNIERQSKANIAYDTAAVNAISAGLGWIRVKTDYCDPLSFDQEVSIDRVLDFRSVYMDPNSKCLDGSDMEYCFVYVDIPEEEFEELYPDADKDSLDDNWSTEETVRIAEYFYKEYKTYTIYKTDKGVVTRQEAELLKESGIDFQIIDQRETVIPTVKWVKMTSNDILEENEWPGKYIPIVPVFGVELYNNNKREFHSLIRQGKDAQKLYNWYASFDAEVVALQPKAPWIGPLGSFESTPNKWAMSNNNNYAYLEYDIVYDENGQRVEPPQRQQPYQGSPHITQKLMTARDDIRLALGMPEAVMGQRSNEISGIAVKNRQIEGDNATFHFSDNLATAISHVGCILVDLIPKLYSERKIARIIGTDGTEETVPVNQPYVKDETGIRPARAGEQYQGIYDLKSGKYDVVCDVGPSYSSKRQYAADTLIQVTQAQPELFGVVGDLLFKSLDMPYSQEIADRLRANMDPAILGDDPMAGKLQAASQAMKQLEDQLMTLSAALDDKKKDQKFEQAVKFQELELKRDELQIKAAETQAQIEKIKAETQNINAQALAPVSQAIMDIAGQVQDVGQALDLILTLEEGAGGQSPEIPNGATQ